MKLKGFFSVDMQHVLLRIANVKKAYYKFPEGTITFYDDSRDVTLQWKDETGEHEITIKDEEVVQ